jgi:hypothetical protein
LVPHTKMNCQVDFQLNQIWVKQNISIFPQLNRKQDQPWPLHRSAFDTLTRRGAGSRATLKQRKTRAGENKIIKETPRPATSYSVTKKFHTRQRSDKLELPLDILVIQLLSRTKIIYRSLARTKIVSCNFSSKTIRDRTNLGNNPVSPRAATGN